MPADQPLLQASALRCERGRTTLFSELSLSLRGGDCIWLRGANGSGKTTLLRTLAGLRAAEQGQVLRHAPLRFIGHANGLKDEFSLQENLRFAAQWQGLPADEAGLLAALAFFDLKPLRRHSANKLSQGQRRRAALALLALPQAGHCWLLDEPFDALDERSLGLLVGLIQSHRDGGGAVLFTSHQAVPGLAAQTLSLDGRAS